MRVCLDTEERLEQAEGVHSTPDTAFSDMAPLPVRLGPTTLPTCRPAAAATAPTLSSSSSELLAPSTPAGVGDVIDTALLQSAPGGQRYAYATLLTRDSYLPGVQALARSLAAVSAQHPLLVLHTPDTLPAAAVAALRLEPGCQPVAMQRYRPPGSHDVSAYKQPLFIECWTKLRMWELDQYDRLAYLDADMIVLRNIDTLFRLPPGFYAAADCAAGRATQAERDACPLFRPDVPHYFNAGFFLMTPSPAQLARWGALLAAGAVPHRLSYAEQDFLNHVLAGAWQALPFTLNTQKGIRRHHPHLWQRHWGEVAVLHFTDAKPWHAGHPDHERDRDLVEMWWQAHGGRLVPGLPLRL